MKKFKFKARWIAPVDRLFAGCGAENVPAPLLVKEWLMEDNPKGEFIVRICGLGFFELCINSRKVSDDVLTPTPTQYDKRWRYKKYNITSYLQRGINTFSILLGNGQYNANSSEVWNFDKAQWRDYPKAIFELQNQGQTILVSDKSWHYRSGPITFDSLRGGEYYDARIPWSEPQNVRIVPPPGGVGEEEVAPACQVVEILPMHCINASAGIYKIITADGLLNISGWVRLHVQGEAGTKITLLYGEKLTADGNAIDNGDIGRFIVDGTFQRDEYILGGTTGVEIWEPRFTYHGFVYVQIITSKAIKILSMEACRIQSNFKSHGTIITNDKLINSLFNMALNSYRANFVGLPLDCPHREKNGWTSEAQLGVELGLYTYSAECAYIEYIETLCDAMRPNGQLPGMAPSAGWGYNWGSGPAWDSALLTIPWQLYLFTGNLDILRRFYPFMTRLMNYYQESLVENCLIEHGLGDWLAPAGEKSCPPKLVCSAFYYYMTELLGKISILLNKKNAAEKYQNQAKQIAKSFNDTFYVGEGIYESGRSTALALPLLFGIVPPQDASKCAEALNDIFISSQGRVDYGTIGSKAVPRALLEYGYDDTVYQIMTQQDYPGYLYFKQHFGYDTFFENWDGSDSRSHGAFCDIAACLYRYWAGFQPNGTTDGILIAPQFPQQLNEFRAEFAGYVCSWRREKGGVELQIQVPFGKQVDLCLPDGRRIYSIKEKNSSYWL